MKYKEKTQTCSGCSWNDSPEHKLFHESGLAEGIIRELKLKSLEEIHKAFANAEKLSRCHISLNGRRTKICEENQYILPKELIDLIDTNTN